MTKLKFTVWRSTKGQAASDAVEGIKKALNGEPSDWVKVTA